MGQHSINEINGLLSHVTPLFLRVFQHNRPGAARRATDKLQFSIILLVFVG